MRPEGTSRKVVPCLLVALAAISALATAAMIEMPATVRAAVDAPDRSDADRALDAGRHPGRDAGVLRRRVPACASPSSAPAGATRRSCSRAPSGRRASSTHRTRVHPRALRREARGASDSQKPVMKNVVRVDREFDDPLPPEARDLDAVLIVLFYHDTVWMRTDRAQDESRGLPGAKAGRNLRRHRSQRASRAPGLRTSRRCTGSRSPPCARRSRRRASADGEARLPAQPRRHARLERLAARRRRAARHERPLHALLREAVTARRTGGSW